MRRPTPRDVCDAEEGLLDSAALRERKRVALFVRTAAVLSRSFNEGGGEGAQHLQYCVYGVLLCMMLVRVCSGRQQIHSSRYIQYAATAVRVVFYIIPGACVFLLFFFFFFFILRRMGKNKALASYLVCFSSSFWGEINYCCRCLGWLCCCCGSASSLSFRTAALPWPSIFLCEQQPQHVRRGELAGVLAAGKD